eukprot:235604-Alexandrium_andersonii.AAC.1
MPYRSICGADSDPRVMGLGCGACLAWNFRMTAPRGRIRVQPISRSTEQPISPSPRSADRPSGC